MNARFEGSFLGDAGKIAADAILECKICWQAYDPAEGDETRQIPPGTPFSALPEDWRCPQCDGERDQFMVVDPGKGAPDQDGDAQARALAARTAAQAKLLAETFRDIHMNKMRDTPFVNRSLSVEAVGFRAWHARALGVLIAPWFMNLIVIPGHGEDWSGFKVGEKRTFVFPSGDYEFIFSSRPPVGAYFACSLFSPMTEFSSQLQAADTARAVIAVLFDEEHRDETDRAAEIRRIREAEIKTRDDAAAASTPGAGAIGPEPTRRIFMTGGLATPPDGALG
jgi:[NiFe] hydrogenase assembly HybE family chaperone